MPDIGLDNLQEMEVGEYLGELAPIVAARGVDPTEVNDLVAYATDLVVTDTSGVDLLDRNQCEVHARNYLGQSYEKTVELAQRASAKLGPEFQEWLNVGGKGNSVGVIAALAAWESGMLKMAPDTAQAKLKKMFEPGSKYMQGDRGAVNRARLLSQIANRQEKKAPAASTAKPPKAPDASVQTELRRWQMDPAYANKEMSNHKQVVARVSELYRQAYGDEPHDDGTRR